MNASDLQEAETLAAWLEAKKFGPKLAGAMTDSVTDWPRCGTVCCAESVVVDTGVLW